MVCEGHGTIVGFSTFYNLHPGNVLVSHSTPHDMCLSQTHENFIRLANALLPPYNQQWIVENAVCQFDERCMLSRCTTCKDGNKLKEAIQGKQVFRCQKVTVDDRLKKVKLIMPVDDAVESILDALPEFLRHVYVKRC